MKKKAWDITVKDNPNRVVMGENDEFYTTDTEAYLVFNLQDQEFRPESALLTLENRNDGSLKSEEVDVDGEGGIQWEMPQRYIEHSGNWQAQLVYEQMKGEVPEKYTSGVMTFTVNSHIQDKKRPSLVEIENWEKFIADGTELIETWEDMEDLRQANEAQRQSNYQELLDTGVLQTNINTKLEALEEEYAPKLTEVTAQLAQTVDEVNRAASELTHDSEVILARGSGVKGKEFESLDERLEENEEDLAQHKLDYAEEISKKANKQQEEWISPTILNGWRDHLGSSAYPSTSFMKDEFGFVHIRGHMDGGEDTLMFTLPSGYRPQRAMFFAVVNSHATGSSSFNGIIVSSTGNVRVQNMNSPLRPSLNVSFKAVE